MFGAIWWIFAHILSATTSLEVALVSAPSTTPSFIRSTHRLSLSSNLVFLHILKIKSSFKEQNSNILWGTTANHQIMFSQVGLWSIYHKYLGWNISFKGLLTESGCFSAWTLVLTLNTTPAMVVPVFSGLGVLLPSKRPPKAAFLERGGVGQQKMIRILLY